ncbi:hypothetical protein AAFF_G00278440 [Aldrovandia affinis]|uniref:Uncharacterized protein n=1 Tax=Aldrovandia affinis TaxID=143900 RepID=A0AAD7SR68_9TELE|nr:hypothetical protein AAFF_G00278440 [Aldrovandia affinis]
MGTHAALAFRKPPSSTTGLVLQQRASCHPGIHLGASQSPRAKLHRDPRCLVLPAPFISAARAGPWRSELIHHNAARRYPSPTPSPTASLTPSGFTVAGTARYSYAPSS